MKVIRVDNFDRDYIPDQLIISGLSKEAAIKISGILNDDLSGIQSPDYFRAVSEDYRLKEVEK